MPKTNRVTIAIFSHQNGGNQKTTDHKKTSTPNSPLNTQFSQIGEL